MSFPCFIHFLTFFPNVLVVEGQWRELFLAFFPLFEGFLFVLFAIG